MTAPNGSASPVGADPVARMLATVNELAAPRYAGRRVGTAGGVAAATWLAQYLAELGARVETDHLVAPAAVRDVYATPALIWGFDRAGVPSGLL